MIMTEGAPPRFGQHETSTTGLVREAFDEVRELTRLEVALAKKEAMDEIRALRACAIAFGAAAVLAIDGIALLLVALAFALGGGVAALIIGIVCLVLAAACAGYGASHLPKKPLDATKKRVEEDVKELKERIA